MATFEVKLWRELGERQEATIRIEARDLADVIFVVNDLGPDPDGADWVTAGDERVEIGILDIVELKPDGTPARGIELDADGRPVRRPASS